MELDLGIKDIDVEKVANLAIGNDDLFLQLLDGLVVKKEAVRANCSKVITYISESFPEKLYRRYWDYFAGLLDHDNTYHKLSALVILANLCKLDIEGRFEGIANKYLDLLNDKSMVTAAWTADNCAKIVSAKPVLQEKITRKLLDIDHTHHHPERKDLIKAYIIQTFDSYFVTSPMKSDIWAFVKTQLHCQSPKTRKVAGEFLEKWKDENIE